jgi:uncharacterized SAM-binding protein YcdF (DUF218 family)
MLVNESKTESRSAGAPPQRGWLDRWRLTVTMTAAVAALMLFGFVMFAANAVRTNKVVTGPADGIIVLTGGEDRIGAGAKLLREGVAKRLLISGVNSQTSRDDVIKLSGLAPAQFSCCVDLGYAAQDTVGNAEEARTWASGLGVRRLIVVTSSYHMPRSLAELAIAMPDTELIAYPVVPKSLRARAWWLQPGLARLLATEYVKFLPVAARYAVARHVTPMVTKLEAAQAPVRAATR